MLRFIPLFTLIPTVFIFVSVMVINIGGVYTENQSTLYEKNPTFNLVNWNFTVTAGPPYNSAYRSNAYHLYLNRICILSQANHGISPAVNHQCANKRLTKLEDGSSSGGLRSARIPVHPFRFKTVDLDIPFAFYVLTALFCFFSMICTIPAVGRRVARIVGLGCSVLTFIWVLVASSVITAQMTTLKHSLLHDTLPRDRFNSSSISINSVSLGTTVLGLTWASTAAALIGAGLWTWSCMAMTRQPAAEAKIVGEK